MARFNSIVRVKCAALVHISIGWPLAESLICYFCTTRSLWWHILNSSIEVQCATLVCHHNNRVDGKFEHFCESIVQTGLLKESLNYDFCTTLFLLWWKDETVLWKYGVDWTVAENSDLLLLCNSLIMMERLNSSWKGWTVLWKYGVIKVLWKYSVNWILQETWCVLLLLSVMAALTVYRKV